MSYYYVSIQYVYPSILLYDLILKTLDGLTFHRSSISVVAVILSSVWTEFHESTKGVEVILHYLSLFADDTNS